MYIGKEEKMEKQVESLENLIVAIELGKVKEEDKFKFIAEILGKENEAEAEESVRKLILYGDRDIYFKLEGIVELTSEEREGLYIELVSPNCCEIEEFDYNIIGLLDKVDDKEFLISAYLHEEREDLKKAIMERVERIIDKEEINKMLIEDLINSENLEAIRRIEELDSETKYKLNVNLGELSYEIIEKILDKRSNWISDANITYLYEKGCYDSYILKNEMEKRGIEEDKEDFYQSSEINEPYVPIEELNEWDLDKDAALVYDGEFKPKYPVF